MFEVAELRPDAGEAALVAHIGELETLKAVAAAAQARATVALVSA
ncbi:HNH endonuclease, partial [Mycolicibacterium chitae]|nr:HNH endonuclease [Mycolicibacterium chitae]